MSRLFSAFNWDKGEEKTSYVLFDVTITKSIFNYYINSLLGVFRKEKSTLLAYSNELYPCLLYYFFNVHMTKGDKTHSRTPEAKKVKWDSKTKCDKG